MSSSTVLLLHYADDRSDRVVPHCPDSGQHSLLWPGHMHPHLNVRRHPHCKQVGSLHPACMQPWSLQVRLLTASRLQEIEALIKCHQEHPYAKFWGQCNQVKWELDACFRQEKALNRCVTAKIQTDMRWNRQKMRMNKWSKVGCLSRAINSEKSKREKARYQEKLLSRSQELQADDGESTLPHPHSSIPTSVCLRLRDTKGSNTCRVSPQQMWSIPWPTSILQRHHLPVVATITGDSTLVPPAFLCTCIKIV